jgi:hypothetical protein
MEQLGRAAVRPLSADVAEGTSIANLRRLTAEYAPNGVLGKDSVGKAT